MSMPNTDPADPMRLVDALQQRAEDLRQQSHRITEALGGATVTVESPYAVLRVAPGGTIESLEFTEAATTAAQSQVVQSVTELYAEAEAEAASRTAAALGTVGMQDAVTAALPPEVRERVEGNR